MLDFKNIILIFIILFLFNQITCKKNNKKVSYKNNIKTNNKIETYINNNNNNKKLNKKLPKLPKVPDLNLLYGGDQFTIKPTFDNSENKYQNLNILRPNNNLELTTNLHFNYDHNNTYDNRNLVHKLDDLNFDNISLTKEQLINNYNNENKKGIITLPLNNINIKEYASPTMIIEEPEITQKMLYDYRFLDMNKNDLEEIIKNDATKVVEGKTLKEIYDNMILDYKDINQKKKPIIKENNKIEGAFGESTVAIDQWYYEDDNNDLSYDQDQDLQLAVNYVTDPNDIY
jgi:hypothetical protein